MPHSPHRRQQRGSTADSPSWEFDASNKNNDNSNDDDKSEDSNPIIWEDDAVTDLRHLFTRRGGDNNSADGGGELLPTMTQQVDDASQR